MRWGGESGRNASQRFSHPEGESRPYSAVPSVGARFIAPNTPPDPSTFNPDTHHRRSLRLRGYDYSQAGAYFITLCTQNRVCLFGDVSGGIVRLNDVGRTVQDVWNALPEYYAGVALDAFVVMPNHIHGILMLHDVGARFIASDNDQGDENQGAMNRAPTIGEIIRAFKARCTHGINQSRGANGVSIWQRNYYEHVIRNEPSLREIREYITNNPVQWAMDRENPECVGARFIAPDDGTAKNQGASPARGTPVGAPLLRSDPSAVNRAPTGLGGSKI